MDECSPLADTRDARNPVRSTAVLLASQGEVLLAPDLGDVAEELLEFRLRRRPPQSPQVPNHVVNRRRTLHGARGFFGPAFNAKSHNLLSPGHLALLRATASYAPRDDSARHVKIVRSCCAAYSACTGARTYGYAAYESRGVISEAIWGFFDRSSHCCPLITQVFASESAPVSLIKWGGVNVQKWNVHGL